MQLVSMWTEGIARRVSYPLIKPALLLVFALIASASCTSEKPAAFDEKIIRLERALTDATDNGDDVKIDMILKELVPLQDRYFRARSRALKKEKAGLSASQKDREIEIPKELSALSKEYQIQKYRREIAENSRSAPEAGGGRGLIAGEKAKVRKDMLELYISKLLLEIDLEKTFNLDEIDKIKDRIMDKQREIYSCEQAESSMRLDKLRADLQQAVPGDHKSFVRFVKEADRYYDFDSYMELAGLERELEKLGSVIAYRNNGSVAWIDDDKRLKQVQKRIKELKDSLSSINPNALLEVYRLGKRDELIYLKPFFYRVWRRLRA